MGKAFSLDQCLKYKVYEINVGYFNETVINMHSLNEPFPK